jgi:two-component system response regulator
MTGQRVLLVEDDSNDMDLTLFAFKQCCFPYPVDVARDGAEAWERLSSAHELPGLVLLDLNLPKLSGLEVLARMRADPRLKRLLVVVLSGSDEPRDKKEAARLGAVRFFNKPVGLEGFVSIVHALEGLLLKAELSGA